MPIGNGGIIGPANVPTLLSANGVWSLREAQLAQRQGIWPVIFDPYFEYTTLLLPGNGTNGAQNNTFLDSSTNNFTITRNGNTTQGNFSPFSQTGWGNYFDGSGDYLSVADNAAFDLGTSDFTIEGWVYVTATSGSQQTLVSKGTGANNQASYHIALDGSTWKYYLSGNGSTWSIASGVSMGASAGLNTWQHIALVRSGSTFTPYVNGVAGTTTTSSASIFDGNKVFSIGADDAATQFVIGYISNTRVVKGTAVYTSNFRPPTAPLTAISGTSLLTCQSNRFIDNSTNNFAITVNGNTSVQVFSPFNRTSSWSAATYGGSGYFDGAGDYLTAPDNAALDLSTGDFTVEFWFYGTASGADRGIVSRNNGNFALATDFQFTSYITVANRVIVRPYASTTNYAIDVGAYLPNQWNHAALVRTGNTFYGFLNGNRSATTQTISGSLNNGSWATYIGGNLSSTLGNQFWLGYVSSVRITKGGALYTNSTYDVPTTPFTTSVSSGTASLLLNFTNAGIYDATSKNDLETVGNAQISTAQSKWGGSSMSFDGTGDWLLIPDQPIQRIGTGNFTVEGWVYRNSSGTYGLIGKGTATTGWLVSLSSSNQVVFTYGSSTITSSGTVSATTWTHIAVVREGTSTNQTKIYINGTNDGIGTVSTDFNQTNSMYVGANRTGGSAANVYMQDVRVTNYARYTANFTAPAAPFPLL